MELVLNLPLFEGYTYFYTAAHSKDYEVFMIIDYTTIHTCVCFLIGISHIQTFVPASEEVGAYNWILHCALYSGVSYVASPTPIHSEVSNELLMAKVQFNTSVIDVKLIADTWKPEFGVKRYIY